MEIGLLRFVNLGRGRTRFSIEVMYLREECDFVFIVRTYVNHVRNICQYRIG